MNRKINLYEVLKNKRFKEFYNDLFGYVKLLVITEDCIVVDINNSHLCLYLEIDGTMPGTNTMALFPSKTQRDWDKYIKDNKL